MAAIPKGWIRALESAATGWEARFNQPRVEGMNFETVAELYGPDKLVQRMPFWRVPTDHPRLEQIGLATDVDGYQAIFVHPMDHSALSRMEAFLGAPDGFVTAQLRSSKRSVVVEKAPAAAPDVFEVKTGFIKGLSAEDVRLAVIQTEVHRGDPHLVDEGAGASFWPDDGQPVSNLYRTSGLANVEPSRDGILVPMTAFLSAEWRAGPGKALGFEDPVAAERWLDERFAPALAQFVVDSLLKRASHFELHAQNLSVYLQPDGKVHLLVRDLQDVREDPTLRQLLEPEVAAARTEKLTKAGKQTVDEGGLRGWYTSNFILLRAGIRDSFSVDAQQRFDEVLGRAILDKGGARLLELSVDAPTMSAAIAQSQAGWEGNVYDAISRVRRVALEQLPTPSPR